MMDLCYTHRASNLDHRYLDTASSYARVILTCELPLSEIVTDFFSQLKSRSSGYASFEYVSGACVVTIMMSMILAAMRTPDIVRVICPK